MAPQPSCLPGGWFQKGGGGGGVSASSPRMMTNISSSSQSKKNGNTPASGGENLFDDKLLAREMNDLTVQDREQVYDEIHGVADIIDETPELVSRSLAEMREELLKIPKRRRRALDRALFLKPSLSSDDKFHLIFLRAERFDPVKAAGKMYRHFNHKLELFGEEKLAKRITLDDLGEGGMAHMRWGAVQTPVVNKNGGRGLFFMAACNENVKDWLVDMRYKWYKFMELVEDEHAQKAGVVSILCFHGEWQHPVSQAINVLAKAHHILFDLPFRVTAQHLCYDRAALHPFLKIFHTLQGSELRVHTRTHFGSEQEVQYSLLSYNIVLPPKPFTVGEGVHSPEYIQASIVRRREIEARYHKEEVQDRDGSLQNPFLFPSPQDVLMGRGWPFQSWQGNVRMAQTLIAPHVDQYIATLKRSEKTKLAVELVQQLQQNMGGHFIERIENQGWVIVSDLNAREKTSQILRAQARAKQEEQKENNNDSVSGVSGAEDSAAGSELTAFERMILDEGLQEEEEQQQRQQEDDYGDGLNKTNSKRIRVL